MPIPKSIARMLRTINSGREISIEDRALLANYMDRYVGRRRFGRPPDPPLIRHRKRFAPVALFEAMRALDIPQDDAEGEVRDRFNISNRSLWSYRDEVLATFPDLRRSLKEHFVHVERLAIDPTAVPLSERLCFLWAQRIGVAVAEAAPEVQIALAEALKGGESLKWFGSLDEAFLAARAAAADVLTPCPQGLSEHAVLDLVLNVSAAAFDAVIRTAIKSQFSVWNARER